MIYNGYFWLITLYIAEVVPAINTGITSTSTLHSKCWSNCASDVWIKSDFSYVVCMNTCFKENNQEWPIKNEVICNASVDLLGSTAACSAKNISIVSYHRTVWRTIREFIIVVWTPCPYGLSDVEGYQINLLESERLGLTYCKQVHLNKTLQPDYVMTSELSVLFEEQELDYDTSYKISIEGLPLSNYRHEAFVYYTSKTCAELNGPGSCQCGLNGFNALPAANIIVDGYHVHASLTLLNPCFQVIGYKLFLLQHTNSYSPLQTIKVSPHETENLTVLHKVFYPIYLSRNNTQLFLQYQAFSKTGDIAASKPARIIISEWKPNIMVISAVGKQIHVTWYCPANSYNISKYEIKLNWYGLHNNADIRYETVHIVTASCVDKMNLSTSVNHVRVGLYSAQLREWRAKSEHYMDAKWSVISAFVKVDSEYQKRFLNEKDLIISATILCPLTVIILICLLVLYCTRKGYCQKIHQSLPFSVENMLDMTSTFQHKNKSIWIVWQVDKTNDEIRELHAENIRHFASFLANHCSLNVILDQYEVSSIYSYSSWIQQKHSEADVVLFICPDVISLPNDAPNTTTGNFSAVFKFYKPMLLNEGDSGKFVTVTLPYSQMNICEEAEFLFKTTPVFRLMDDIEGLYFFIQNCAKVSRLGRLSVKYIHHREYSETMEGKALKCGIENILKIKTGETNESKTGDTCSAEPKCSRQKTMQIIPPISLDEKNVFPKYKDTRPNPPPSVLDDEDADESVFLINTHELLSLQPISNDSLVEPVTCETYCSLISDMPSPNNVWALDYKENSGSALY